tara:strand:+ start:28991 stop:29701 length:711 start_codon:yes stop_codon:yes gene_type:complete
MRTLKFSSVLYGVAQLAGLDRDNLPTHFFKQVRDLANQRLSVAWESERWPDLVRVSSATVTTANDINTAPYPTTAGIILQVYQKDPRSTTNAVPVSYSLYDTGTAQQIVLQESSTPVYVEYSITRPNLIGNTYNANTDYAVDDQVYYSTTGQFYDMIVNAGAGTVPTTTNNWAVTSIPKIFENYLIRGIYADYLRANGQIEIASLEDRTAEAFLTVEADKVYRQQGQVKKINFVGY